MRQLPTIDQVAAFVGGVAQALFLIGTARTISKLRVLVDIAAVLLKYEDWLLPAILGKRSLLPVA